MLDRYDCRFELGKVKLLRSGIDVAALPTLPTRHDRCAISTVAVASRIKRRL
ncbi:MAG: hypothetical protein H7306_02645 [Bacteriovorax sp.]|nr:hypothetical protein [Rhizobacter sp.]